MIASVKEVKTRYGLPRIVSKYLADLSSKDDRKEFGFYKGVLKRLCPLEDEFLRAKNCLSKIMED